MSGNRFSDLFNSMFGESSLEKDCGKILKDPNADPIDKLGLDWFSDIIQC